MRLLYIADPMCSWCWGFSPVIAAIADRFRETAPVEVVMGGLRPGTSDPMTSEMKTTIREHWEHVRDASGQPFDFSLFERDGFVYDTEPACRAAVTVREREPRAVLPFLAAVQRAFYTEARDVTAGTTLADVAEDQGLEREPFLTRFESDAMREATRADFGATARLGVRGFPTLVGDDGDRLVLLTAGYRPLEALLPVVEAWTRGEAPANF